MAISSRREFARMPVVPYAFWCLHTEQSSTWCNELHFLLPINTGIAVIEARATVGALMELEQGANWMRTAIPGFWELIEPLPNLLESQYSIHKTRVKSKIRGRNIGPCETLMSLHGCVFDTLDWRAHSI